MAQHKTIDRRKAATDNASVAQRLAEQRRGQGQTKNAVPGSAAVAPAQKQNTQTYYSPREYGSQSQTLGARVTAAQTAMQEQSAALEQSRRAMEQLYAQAGQKRQRYYDLTGSFVGDTAAEYEKRILDDWTEAVDLYVQGQAEYQKAYDAYKPYEQEYNAALGAYNDYVTQEKAAYDQWRATVRSADEIRQERSEIRSKRAELERLMKENNRLNDPGQISSGADVLGRSEAIAGNEARIRELQEYLGGIGERERLLEEELGWSEKLRWEDLRQNGDFDQGSVYQAERFQNPVDDFQYNYINTRGSNVPDDPRFASDYDYGKYRHMSRDEISMYNYLYSTRGADGAREYLDYLDPELNKRSTGEQMEALQAWAVEHPFLASGVSVAMSPVSGVTSRVGQIAAKLAGEEIDPNAGYNVLTNQKNAIREAVGMQIEQTLGEKWGPVGSFGYNIGMSMLDMLADKWSGIGLAGGGAGGSLAIKGLMGSRAVAETVIDGKNRGLSDGEAFKLGLIAGAAELITEGIGLDEMLKLPKGMKDAGFWKGALKGAVGEAGEEGLTNLANLVADISIAGEKSEFARSIEGYKAAGMDDTQALNQALLDAGISLGLDMLGGGISGGVFGGVDGWKGKRAAAKTQQKTETAADTAASDNGTETIGNETVRDGRTVETVGKPGAVGAKKAQGEGGVPVDDAGDADGMTLEEARTAAVNRRNPLVSKVLPTAQVEEEVRRLKAAETMAQVTGIDLGVDQERIDQADRLGKLLGKEVYFFSENPTEYGTKHGQYGVRSDRIGINVKSPNVLAATFGHELTHSVEIADSYGELRELVLNRIRQTGEDLDHMRRSRQEHYARNGVELDIKDIDQEIVAKYVEEHLLTDEKSIRQLVTDNRNIAQRILGWLDSVWARFSKSERGRERDFVRRARQIYRTALQEAEMTRRDQARRGKLRGQMHQAYRSGNDMEADAMFEEMYGGRTEGLLSDDFDDADVDADGADTAIIARGMQTGMNAQKTDGEKPTGARGEPQETFAEVLPEKHLVEDGNKPEAQVVAEVEEVLDEVEAEVEAMEDALDDAQEETGTVQVDAAAKVRMIGRISQALNGIAGRIRRMGDSARRKLRALLDRARGLLERIRGLLHREDVARAETAGAADAEAMEAMRRWEQMRAETEVMLAETDEVISHAEAVFARGGEVLKSAAETIDEAEDAYQNVARNAEESRRMVEKSGRRDAGKSAQSPARDGQADKPWTRMAAGLVKVAREFVPTHETVEHELRTQLMTNGYAYIGVWGYHANPYTDDGYVAKLGDAERDAVFTVQGDTKSMTEQIVQEAVRRGYLTQRNYMEERWKATEEEMRMAGWGYNEFGDIVEIGEAHKDGEALKRAMEDLPDGWASDDFSDLEFSFGGENAANIDREALERAKQMRAEGEENADIFRETGWYVGADGKWRFEIDDSKMKYRRGGDAQFRADHPEYTRFRELERKFIDGAITDEEIMEMAALRSTWSDEARRLAERVARGNAWLADVLEYDALYEQYPRLRRVKVRFGDTDDAGGWWDKGRNEIVLSERYRQADPAFLELKLLHEIQHAIQDIEGFAGGSNPEYWEQIQKGSEPIRELDGQIAKAEREVQEALKGIPPEVAKDFWYAANMVHTDPEGAERLENELFESEYADAYSDYSWAIWTLQDLLEQENPKRSAMDLYRSTAGEIEARDAANRKNLDARVRKNRLPNTGDERTVFVEGDSPVAGDFIGWTADGNEVYQTSAATMAMSSHDRFENFKKNHLANLTGRTAKFRRNGHTYYARFEQTESNLGKLAHEGTSAGSKSSVAGYRAKIRMLADGSVFELVEDANYKKSRKETGTGKNKTHKNAKHWDYFVKTVVVDGKAYDVLINIRTDSKLGDYSDKEQFVYSIRFRDNKTAATPVASPATSKVLRQSGVTADISVPDSGQIVKQYSIGEPEEEGSHQYSDEELRNRASMEEDGADERPTWTAVEPERLTGTAKDHYDRVLRQAVEGLARSLNVPRVAKREYLMPIARELGREYMAHGTVSAEVRDRLFDKAWDEGRNQEREFYDTYKEVKDYLRTTGLTLGETDRDSRDWGDIRRRAFGTVKLLNEGGLPVDTAWGKLREMAPELFPEDIYNPADQLQHMIEVGRSIKPREQTLEEYYGPNAADVKAMERMDFDAAIQRTIADLWKVKRVADERIAETTPVAGGSGSELTQEEVTAMYPKLKDARKAVEKAIAKNILTKGDKEQVQRLLRHDIQPEHLDHRRDNVEGILAVYEAKKAFEEIAEPIRAWNRQQKAANYRLAENLLEGVRLKDKKRGFLYSRETMARNIRDIVKDPEAAERIIRTYFKPLQEASAQAIRIQNRYRDRVRALGLSRKVAKGNQVSEAYAVQFYGEVSDILKVLQDQENRLKHPNPARLAKRVRDGKTYEEWQSELKKLWEENPGLDKGKIENVAREFGKIYEELYEQMNEVRVRNGYEPINHRSGYFPHFQREGRDGILGQFGKALGIDVEVQQLPTTINGLTHTFKPGIRWLGNALERKGFDTEYDAVEGFDRYITGVSDVICHTDNIQRLRALANRIRYRTSDEGIREQIRKIQERTDITEDEKDTLIRERYESGKFELSNFVVELDEYTNLLANKKSRADRNMEQAIGRDAYNVVKALESRVAANMVAINPGSWLTNFIPITQGWACLDRGNLIRGMGQTLAALKNDDGMVDRSAFLTGRKGTDALVQTTAQGRIKEWTEKQKGPLKWVGKYADGSIMEWIDGFTAGSLVRARYQQNLGLGLSEAEAMSEADDWAAGVMADRTKGAMPTVFHRSNPLTKLFTQFQLEVNNQLSYVWKDIPREKRDKGMKALALALLKFAVGAWLYNEVYEFFFGRRPALDIIGILNDTVGDITGYELPNMVELGVGLFNGDLPSFRVERGDLADVLTSLGGNIAENTPFVGGLLGGGRVPISSALPDVPNLVKAAFNTKGEDAWSAKRRLGTAAKELAKPLAYMLPPFGGGQIKKVWEGLSMIAKGGSYTLDAEGNPMLQYPLYSTNNDVQKALEAGQAMIFGKTTIRSGREWVEGGFGNLSAEQTATYQALIAMDVEQADAFELLTELREAEKTDEQSRTAVQREILRASGLEGDALATVYYDLFTEEDSKERQMLDELLDDDADMGKAAMAVMDIKDVDATMAGVDASCAKRDILRESGLEGNALSTMYYHLLASSDKERAMFDKLRANDADMCKVANAMMDIKDADSLLSGAKRSNTIRDAILYSGLTESQKRTIYRYAVTEEHEEKIDKFQEVDLDFDEYLIARSQYSTIDEQYEDQGDKATAFARWVNKQGYTTAQKSVVRDVLKYWEMMPANADRYDAGIEAGLSDQDAYQLREDLKALEPLVGEDDVKQYQKWRVAVDNAWSEEQQLQQLQAAGMNDASYAKCEALWSVGVAPAAYVRAYELKNEFNEDGKGNLNNDEWTKLIENITTYDIVLPGDNNRFHLTAEQKSFLWQVLTGSKSTKNNPWGSTGGEKWLEIKKQMKGEEE